MKWIKHDTDANQDAKLQNVLLDYGLEGYGLYWYCIELIAGKVDKDNITFDLEHDARIIAKNTGSTPQKVEEMMRYFVKTGLFEDSSGVITCFKLARRLDKSMTSNVEMRAIIDNLKNHDSVMTKSDKPMQDKNRLDKNKDMIDLGNQPPLFSDEKEVKQDYLEERTLAFDDFWRQWGDNKKMVGKVNTAPKSTVKTKFLNQTFNASKVRAMGIDAFNEEVELMLDLAWNAHSDIAKHDKTKTESSWFNYRSMYPSKFLSNAQWRDQA